MMSLDSLGVSSRSAVDELGVAAMEFQEWMTLRFAVSLRSAVDFKKRTKKDASKQQCNRLHKLHRRPPLNSGHRRRNLAHHGTSELMRQAPSVANNNPRNLDPPSGSRWFHWRVLENHLASRRVLIGFIYMVTMKGSGHPAPSRAYLEYSLQDFSGYLRQRVQTSYKWDRIRTCLGTTNICPELNQRFSIAQDFFNAHLSPIQSGCCKPPTKCGFNFVNPTYWMSPTDMSADMDCLQWNNEQNTLCYSCDSCKAGLLANLKLDWFKADICLLLAFVGLIIVYIIGCCAFRNAKTKDTFKQ
ncbi:hypothetical protein Bca101_013297 [Brassica carinata]